jgi:diacylglycerol kinase family enzyme
LPEEQSIRLNIIAFANPLSGKGHAKKYISKGYYEHKMKTKSTQEVLFSVFDVTRADQFQKGLDLSKRLQDTERVIFVTMGGDGTFMRLVSDLQATGINLDHAQFVVLPFGTGNDLANSLGWGKGPEKILNPATLISDIISKTT